jgi:hypothetical protein
LIIIEAVHVRSGIQTDHLQGVAVLEHALGPLAVLAP